METQYIFVLLVVGAVTINSEGKHISKRRIDVFDVDMKMQNLNKNMRDIKTGVETAFTKIEKGIQSRRNSCVGTLSTEYQDTERMAKVKFADERKEVLERGEEVNATLKEACFQTELTRYAKIFGKTYQESLICVQNATKTATDAVKGAREKFKEAAKRNEDLGKSIFQKWEKSCKKQSCINDNLKKFTTANKGIQDASKEPLESGRKASEKHKKDTDTCLENYRGKSAKDYKEHQDQLIGCIKNPRTRN